VTHVSAERDDRVTVSNREEDPTRPGRVVILAPTAWGLRNMVLSGALDRLRENLGSVTLLASSQANNALAEQWSDDSETESLVRSSRIPVGLLPYTVSALLHASFGQRFGIASYRIFGRWRRRDATALQHARYQGLRALASIAGLDPFFGWQVRYLEGVALRSAAAAEITAQLNRLRPSLVVSTSCVVSDEVPYILAARRLGIPTLGCILSFDNLTSKSVLPTFDHYAVWARRMGEEVLRYYPDRDPARIHATGTPQFDFHRRAEYRWSRERTLRELGLAPGERYLLYAANSATYTPTEPDLIAAGAEACDRTPSLRQHRIIVRPHPADDPARWAGVAALHARIRLARPRETGTPFATEEAQARLVSSILHADVCLNMASTMSLDAAVLDTPIVCVAFAHDPDSEEAWLARACYRTEHFEPVAASGGVRVAHTAEELVQQTASYVDDRSRDREGRAKLVRDICGVTDGHAGMRVADLIIELATASARQTERS
jgi:hypothetical protein